MNGAGVRPELPSHVLVTGAGGIIGRSVVSHLLSLGVAVTAMSLVDVGQWPSAVRAVTGDASAEGAVREALAGCDAVVHLAALAHPSLGTPREVFANNVVSTFTVLAGAAATGIGRAVIASSVHANGVALHPGEPMPAYFPLDEKLPYDIADPYSLSKQVDELSASMAAHAWGLSVVALRFPLVKPDEQLRQIRAATLENPATMMRTGWGYLTLADSVASVVASLSVPLSGSHVIGLSAPDNLLGQPSAELVATYAPQVPLRRPLADSQALIDTTLARQLLGLPPGRSINNRDGITP